MPAYASALGEFTVGVIIKALLGTPMRHRGEKAGNFILGEKQTAPEFTAEVEAVVVLDGPLVQTQLGLCEASAEPLLNVRLPDGSRSAAVLPPISEAPVLTIRNHPAKAFTVDQLVASGTLPEQVLETARHMLGHPDQLNRATQLQGIEKGLASPYRACEELRAEISSVMTADRLRIGHNPSRLAPNVDPGAGGRPPGDLPGLPGCAGDERLPAGPDAGERP